MRKVIVFNKSAGPTGFSETFCTNKIHKAKRGFKSNAPRSSIENEFSELAMVHGRKQKVCSVFQRDKHGVNTVKNTCVIDRPLKHLSGEQWCCGSMTFGVDPDPVRSMPLTNGS
jgi:hypothetical protein